MKLLVGLGNPTSRFERTRHNVGFRIAERFADRHRITLDQKKWNAVLGAGPVAGEKVAVLLPQTYMNLSGEAAGPAMRFHKMGVEDVIVVHDELDLPLGRLQLKKGGGSGGHNGLKSLVQHLGGPDFWRLRVGVSRPPPKWDPAAWVLADFSAEEEQTLDEVMDRAVAGLDLWLARGPTAALNEINRREKPASAG